MRTQLHLSGSATLAKRVVPVINDPFLPKPQGGFWTSTFLDGSGGWARFCESEDFRDVTAQHWFLLEVDPTARVYMIAGLTDLQALLADFTVEQPAYSTFRRLDFERLSERYDGINLTEEGQWATRLSRDNLYGWDCESTLWFRWKFTSVAKIPAAGAPAALAISSQHEAPAPRASPSSARSRRPSQVANIKR